MNRSLLPLNALRAFEVSARHASFSKAAGELCVTHSAISQQIKQLEALLGLRLFYRGNRGVQLTEAGQTLLPILGESFDRIGETLEGLKKGGAENSITVTTTPSFATKWLMPRLRRWYREPRALPVHLHPTLSFLDLAAGEADVGIRCGEPPWKGLKNEFLLPIHMSPLCSPSLIEGGQALLEPRDVFGFTLIHADIAGHELGEEWKTWLGDVGVEEAGKLAGLSFHDPNLALQAAADGLGIAMGYAELAEQDVASGRLLYPFRQHVRHRLAYHLVYPAARTRTAKIKAFCDWVLAESRPTVTKSR